MLKESSDKNITENVSQIQELVRQNDQLRKDAIENNELKRQLVHLQNERALLIQ